MRGFGGYRTSRVETGGAADAWEGLGNSKGMWETQETRAEELLQGVLKMKKSRGLASLLSYENNTLREAVRRIGLGEKGEGKSKRKGRGTREREGVGGGIKEGRKKGKRLEAYQMSGDACPTYMNVGTLITDPEDRVNKVWMLTKQNK